MGIAAIRVAINEVDTYIVNIGPRVHGQVVSEDGQKECSSRSRLLWVQITPHHYL